MVSERGAPSPAAQSRKSRPMRRTLIRLAPSQAGGKLLSGISTGGAGSSSIPGTGVLSSFVKSGPLNPAVTVPQLEGTIPGKGVILQQVTRLRTKKKPPTARISPTTMKIICVIEGRANLMFLKKFILFIRVLYIPYPGQGGPSLLWPNVVTAPSLLPSPSS